MRTLRELLPFVVNTEGKEELYALCSTFIVSSYSWVWLGSYKEPFLRSCRRHTLNSLYFSCSIYSVLFNPNKNSNHYNLNMDSNFGLSRKNEEMRIVMVGKTRTGKSASGNTILGRQFFDSKFSAKSLTVDCSKGKAVVDGQQVVVIDTPGLFDTWFGKDKTSKDMCQCITYAAPGPHVFLAVIRLGRYTEEEKQTVQKIQDIFGQAADRYSMVLFTHGDQLEDTTIEDFLKGSSELQELVARCNGQYHVFNNKLKDRSQVTELLQKIRNLTQKNGGSHYTNKMFQEAEREIEKEKQRILKEIEEKIRKEQQELERKLQEKYEKQMKKMNEQLQAERERERKEKEEERKREKEEREREKKEREEEMKREKEKREREKKEREEELKREKEKREREKKEREEEMKREKEEREREKKEREEEMKREKEERERDRKEREEERERDLKEKEEERKREKEERESERKRDREEKEREYAKLMNKMKEQYDKELREEKEKLKNRHESVAREAEEKNLLYRLVATGEFVVGALGRTIGGWIE